jgi:opacity protein-like surface antigen
MRTWYRLCMLLALLAWAIGPANAQSANFNWQGFYIGAHASHFSAGTDYANPDTPSQQFGGAMLGLQAGYNWQFGRLVVGAEADIAFGSLNDFVRDGNFLTQDGEIGSFGTLRARLGYSFGNFLPYVTGGLMWTYLHQGITCPAGATAGICLVTGAFDVRSTEMLTGWTFGAGAEYALNRNWSIKGDILFGHFNTKDYTGTVPVFGKQTTPVELDLDYVTRLGVNFRF